jgi:ribosomal protein S6
MKRSYQATFIFRPDLEVTEKTAPDLVKKLVGEQISVTDITVSGKKPLSYPIKKQTEGIYVSATISAERLNIDTIEKKVQLGAEVIRFLLTNS